MALAWLPVPSRPEGLLRASQATTAVLEMSLADPNITRGTYDSEITTTTITTTGVTRPPHHNNRILGAVTHPYKDLNSSGWRGSNPWVGNPLSEQLLLIVLSFPSGRHLRVI